MRNGAKNSEVLISYAHSDAGEAGFVNALAKQLESFGVGTIAAPVAGATKFDEQLRDALTKCSLLLVVLTPKSLESPAVNFEIGAALGQGKKVVPLYPSAKTMRSGAARPFRYLQGIEVERQSPAEVAKRIANMVAESSQEHGQRELQKFWGALRSSSGVTELD